MEIKFNSKYPKLFGQTKAKLILVEKVYHMSLSKDFIKYDTQKLDGSYYELNNVTYTKLTLIGNKGIPFTTLRNDNKESFYLDRLNNFFDIVIL